MFGNTSNQLDDPIYRQDHQNRNYTEVRTMRTKKGYTSPTVCLDGKDSHEWDDDFMLEDGIEYPVKVCKKCGYWS